MNAPNSIPAIIESILPAMSALNSWARLPYDEKLGMSDAVPQIYRYKRTVIAEAMRQGMAKLWLVSVERPCKTCKGSGTYEWHDWNDEDHVEYEGCRRCGSTGKVTLRFVVSEIAGVRWHTPRPKWDLGLFTESDRENRCETKGDWEPEQPGRVLSRIELIQALNAVERELLPPLVPYETWPAPDSKLPPYRLDLGKIWSCPFCGRDPAAGVSAVYGPHTIICRPGLHWKQNACWGDRNCVNGGLLKPLEWPHDLLPPRGGNNDQDQWEYHVPLPAVAQEPVVIEWLARRGIVAGAYPPDECVWSQGGTLLKNRSPL